MKLSLIVPLSIGTLCDHLARLINLDEFGFKAETLFDHPFYDEEDGHIIRSIDCVCFTLSGDGRKLKKVRANFERLFTVDCFLADDLF